MMAGEEELIHIFSVHEPGTRSSSFVWLPVQTGHEDMTDDEILEAEKSMQLSVHTSRSKTAVVKYFATAPRASNAGLINYDPHFDENRIE